MKNKLWIPVVALLLVTSVDSFGQRWKLRRYAMDIYLGTTSFHGDIGLANQSFSNTFKSLRPGLGVRPRFLILENLALSVDLGYMMYGGKDVGGSTHGRVYSFDSHAFQHVARLEYYIIGAQTDRITKGAIFNRRGMVNQYNQIYVYLYGGAGGVISKAKVKDLSTGEELVNTPGYDNNMQYSGVFPVGAGIKWSIDPRWSIGVEMGFHWSTSDLLDGYASESSEYRDSYYLTSVKAIYKIRNDRQGRPIFRKLFR